MERQAGEMAAHFEAIKKAAAFTQGPLEQGTAIIQKSVYGIGSILLRTAVGIGDRQQGDVDTKVSLQGKTNLELNLPA